MGVDLTIMPQDWKDSEGGIHAYSALSLSRDRALWEAIGKSGIEVELTAPTTCHFARTEDGDTRFGEVLECPYGTPLTRCLAGELSDVMGALEVSGKNVWIAAALKAMSPEQVIVLYWH